jgi:hypothetical protein
LSEVALRFNLVFIFAVFDIPLHSGENPLDGATACSGLASFELTRQAV